MQRIVCIDVPALPLQILRRDRPEWGGFPLAVVAEDRPQASVLSVSRSARELGIRPGMRYAAALGITRELRAGVVAPSRIAETRAELVGALHRLSPRVEPDSERISVIWIDPRGMLALFGSYEHWADEAQAVLDALNLFGMVVVGFRRMPALAVARGERRGKTKGTLVLSSIEEESQLAARTLLGRLDLTPSVAESLHLFGIQTLGELLALPAGEISVRFGPEAQKLHQACLHREDERQTPLQPSAHPDPIEIDAEIDPPDDDRTRLLFCIKGALHALVAALVERRLALGALHVTLFLERAVGLVPQMPVRFSIEPGTATRDAVAMLELIRLRLESQELPGRAQRLHLTATPAPLEGTQLLLTESARRRDPKALARGLSRLRAAFGSDAVTRAHLESSWAPEAAFRWEPIQELEAPRPRLGPRLGPRLEPPSSPPQRSLPRLLRRVLERPVALETDGRGLPRIGPEPLIRLIGPYRVQSGWWAEARLMRDYFYAERGDGAIFWLFRDQASSHWYLQGLLD